MDRRAALIDWLLVARTNRYGMTRDAEILLSAIGEAGGSGDCAPSHRRNLFDWLRRRKKARNVLFLERIHPMWLSAARRRWLMPNQERYPRRHVKRLKLMDGVLAKTRHAQEIFATLGVKTRLVGFTSDDCRDSSVEKDWSSFLHVAGANTLKGTEDILALWTAHPEWPELVLIQNKDNAPKQAPGNVTVLSGFVDQAKLRELQNRCGIHLCPSRSEGWGHYIVEALSAGAVVVTTDGPPMNEHVTSDCGVLVPFSHSAPRHLGTSYFVDGPALEKAIERLIAMPDAQKAALGRAARARYEAIDSEFRRRVRPVFEQKGAG